MSDKKLKTQLELPFPEFLADKEKYNVELVLPNTGILVKRKVSGS